MTSACWSAPTTGWAGLSYTPSTPWSNGPRDAQVQLMETDMLKPPKVLLNGYMCYANANQAEGV